MKDNTKTGTGKKPRPEPEFQRDDLRNQSFYHVGLEYYPKTSGDKTESQPAAKAKSPRKKS